MLRLNFRHWALLAISFVLYLPVLETQADEMQLEHQRALFVEAEKLATNPKSKRFKQHYEQLQGYPLRPYLELKWLSANPYWANKARIEAFLEKYAGSPLDRPLRRKWLYYLAEENRANTFLEHYQYWGDAELACKHLAFQLEKQPDDVSLLKSVATLWVVGKSQPRACDPLFKKWQKAGLRTEQHVWQRIRLAADGGKASLLPYLGRQLPKEKRYLAELWLKVRRSPSMVSRKSLFPGTFPDEEAEIITYGLSRLVFRDRELALKSYQRWEQARTFTDQQHQKIANKFAIGLALNNHPEANIWLEKANSLQEDSELMRWHLAHTLRQQDWQQALTMIERAPESLVAQNGYQYWQGRALQQLDAPERANNLFQTVAKERDYYGFLASGHLALAPSFVDRPLNFNNEEIEEVASFPAAQRAFELLQLNRFTQARREWNFLQTQLTEQQKLISAVLADSWGWHDRAISTFTSTGYMDDVKRRFPLAYQEQLLGNAERNQVDPAWAFAIARRESAFMTDANSGAGAKGLMQLLPGTAKYLARKKVSSRSLFDAQKNTEYGTQYLRYLMDKMHDNPILATAAYNAGWRRVKKWLPENEPMPVDIWIETIPYKETRNYVKAVMAYRQIYAQQLGKPVTLFDELVQMQITPE